MDDDFAYQIVDYGLGAVEVCDNRPVRDADVFWLRVRLTNESAHLLASPRYFDRITVTDNWGNSYQRVSFCRLNKQNRYKPGESVVETVTVDASEFVDDVADLRATLGGGPAFLISDPVRRRQPLRQVHRDLDPKELAVRVETDTGKGLRTAPAIVRSTATCGVDVDVSCPRVLHEVRPQYSRDALRAKIQGSVGLEIMVRPDGSVGDVQLVRSLDRTFCLDEQAVSAARRWRFAPGTRNGEPVSVVMTIELTFTLP